MTTVKTDNYIRLPNTGNTTFTRRQPTLKDYALMFRQQLPPKDVYQTAIERANVTEYETVDAREILGLDD